MRILLDTAPFLWLASSPERIPKGSLGLILDPDNEVFLSAVSSWEIAVKTSLGRLVLSDSPERLVPQVRAAYAIEALELSEESTFQLERLPDLHRDPFDRMLLCQAIAHGLAVVTPDAAMRRYPVRTMW